MRGFAPCLLTDRVLQGLIRGGVGMVVLKTAMRNICNVEAGRKDRTG